MSAITSLLVRDQVVPVRKIEEALQRQVISGGEIETVLLEMDVAPENIVSAYRAALFGLLPATRDEVMRATREVVRLVPREVAEQHRIVPLAAEERTLVVALATPLSADVDQQLGFLLGFELVPRIVTDARIAAALAHHYGVPIAPRLSRLADKLRSREPGTVPYVAPPYTARFDRRTSELPTKAEIADDNPLPPPPATPSTEPERRPSTSPFGHSRPSMDAARISSASGAITTPGSPSPIVGVSHVVGVGSQPPPARRTAPGSQPAPAKPPSTPAPSAPQVPPAASLPHEAAATPAGREPATAARAATPQPAPAVPSEPSRPATTPAVSSVPPALSRRLRGPLVPKAALELLSDATNRDEILAITFAFARQFFDYTALFVVHEDIAEGRDAYGQGASPEEVQRITIPLDVPSILAEVRRTKDIRLGALSWSELDRVIAHDLRRDATFPGAVLPIPIRNRVVLMIFGDRSGEPFGVEDIPELVAFLPRVSEAFERIILKRKFRGYEPSGGGGDSGGAGAGGGGSGSSDDRAQLKARAREVAGEVERSRPPAGAFAPRSGEYKPLERSTSSAPPGSALGGPAALSSIVSPAQPSSARREAVDRGADRVDRMRPASTILGMPPADSEPTAPPAPRADRLVRETRQGVGVDAKNRSKREPSAPFAVLGVPRSAPPPPAPAEEAPSRPINHDEPLIRVEEGEPDETDNAVDDVFDRSDPPPPRVDGSYSVRDAASDVVPKLGSNPPPSPRSEMATPSSPVRSPRPDPRREDDADSEPPHADVVHIPAGTARSPSEPSAADRVDRRRTPLTTDEPKVIVDMGESIEALVRELCTCGPDDEHAAVAALVRVGEAALPVLSQRFPGPLWFDRNQPHKRLPRGRDISPIARALVAFHDRAVPYVSALLDSGDDDVRFYATLLGSEIVHPGVVEALGRRVFDEDAGTRALVLDVLRLFRRFPEFDDVLKAIRVSARVPGREPMRRVIGARALGELRDEGALELLVSLLKDDDTTLVQTAERALVLLTRQDFGESHRKWQTWAEKNAHRHRIEWLIDGLLHENETLRAAAGDELKRITQEYYGFHPASPRKDRERVQRKYLAWWSQEGKRRFAT